MTTTDGFAAVPDQRQARQPAISQAGALLAIALAIAGAFIGYSLATDAIDPAIAQLTAADKDALAKLHKATHQLVPNETLVTLRGVGRFQLIPLGVRVWRLDTVTGQNCLLLTSDEDWKKPTVSAQGCQ